jgi:hypothetical protein
MKAAALRAAAFVVDLFTYLCYYYAEFKIQL